MMGYEPRDLPLAFRRSHAPAAEERLTQLKLARDEAAAAHELARMRMAERNMRNFTPFREGERVWLEGKNLHTPYESRKMAPKQEGPFVIEQVLGPLTYKLKLLQQWRIHPVFHAALLSPYRETTAHGPNYPQPPPDLIEGEEQYEVEAILAHKRTRGGLRYLIKWTGYPSGESTWQVESDLKDASEILEAYKLAHHL
jgi:hypothetical protein